MCMVGMPPLSPLHKRFDLREDDVYACVADVGWITGPVISFMDPFSNGSTTLMFGSTPLYPDAGRYWDIAQRHKSPFLYGTHSNTCDCCPRRATVQNMTHLLYESWEVLRNTLIPRSNDFDVVEKCTIVDKIANETEGFVFHPLQM